MQKTCIQNGGRYGLEIRSGEVHLWTSRLDRAERLNLDRRLLPSEIEAADRAQSPSRKRELTIARSQLRFLLATYLDMDPLEITFEIRSGGRPEFKNRLNLDFSLAHSGQWSVFAVGRDLKVGVDLEVPRERDLTRIERKVFNPTEADYARSLGRSHRESFFCDIWTKKEAATKLLGKGLSIPFEEIFIEENRTVKIPGVTPCPAIALRSFHCEDFFLNLAVSSHEPIQIFLKGSIL